MLCLHSGLEGDVSRSLRSHTHPCCKEREGKEERKEDPDPPPPVQLIVRLRAFGVTITALRRQDRWGRPDDDQLTRDAEAALADRGCWPGDTARLAAGADVVVLTCHQDASSRGLVDGEFLGHCKRGVRIVNVARGGAALPSCRPAALPTSSRRWAG